jgi:hypothetical protein
MSKDELAKAGTNKLMEANELDMFVDFVNHAPPKESVHNHPIAKGVKYIPIDHIETMMDKIFKIWNVEILREGQLLNSVYVTVRVNYKHPITGEWQHQDGVGAVAIQVDQGKDASDLKAIKSNAIMLGLPSAKSFAIKDAVEHIGKSFGRDINRKDVMAFKASNVKELAPNIKLVTVAQINTLELAAVEYSGLEYEQAQGWFVEIIGNQPGQVLQVEFDDVLKALEEARNV